MASDLDTFTLEYKVDVKDSVGRLEKLNEKMGKVEKGAKDSGSSIKQFGADAASELGKLIPGIDAVGAAIKGMGAEFAAAGAAIAVLAVGIKSVMDMRQQFNAQRLAGQQIGASGARVENWQRQFVRNGSQYSDINRDSALAGITQFSDMANSAFQDPTRMSREARLMRMMGINVGSGKNPTGTSDRLTQLATYLQGKSPGMVQGVAKTMGVNQDWLLTLQKIGPQIGKITDLTSAQVDQYSKGEDTLSKFNAELGKFNEDMNELEMKLGENVLPAMDKFIQFLTKVTDLFNKSTNPSGGTPYHIVNGHRVNDTPAATSGGTRHGHMGPGHTWIEDPLTPVENSAAAEAARKSQQDKAAEDKKRNDAVNKMDESNKQGLQTANEMTLAVNMFAGAVSSFSGAINMQQAWAAWAGEIGKANGLPGSSTNPNAVLTGGGKNDWQSGKYAAEIAAAAKAKGVDPQLLVAVMMTESHGINGQYSSTGAGGLMQITRGNWAKIGGGADIMNPAANIMGGAQILKESIARANGDVAKGLGYYNGNSDPNYVNKVSGYYGGKMIGQGESRDKMQKMQVQQAIASYLGVPLQQIQLGGVHSGDAQWATSQIEAGLQNSIFSTKRQLAVGGVSRADYARLQQELVSQTRGLDLMKQYSNGVVGGQQVGDRTRTVGEFPIIINVNGAQDPKAVGAAVNDALRKSMTDLLMNNATGIKG